jgi:hypothetical protein
MIEKYWKGRGCVEFENRELLVLFVPELLTDL